MKSLAAEMGHLVTGEIKKELAKQDWPLTLKKLTAYAAKKIRPLSWRGEQGGLVPGGNEAMDFASQAICKLHNGERVWNPEKDPDLFGFLCNTVDSMVSNAVTSIENQTSKRLEKSEDSEESSAIGKQKGVPLHEYDWELLESFHESLSDEPELLEVVNCVKTHGLHERSDIAEALGVSAAEVSNRRKRLERRLSRFHEQIEADSSGVSRSPIIEKEQRQRTSNQERKEMRT